MKGSANSANEVVLTIVKEVVSCKVSRAGVKESVKGTVESSSTRSDAVSQCKSVGYMEDCGYDDSPGNQ